MMRKFTNCLMVCAAIFFATSCKDDVSSPPKSTLSVVPKTDGLAGETEFTFTVDEAPGAGTVSILPYGTANLSEGGIIVSSFVNGKAEVKFTYAKVGTFDAIVVTNNHSSDGKTVKNTYSNTVSITIKSEKNQITEFIFDKISTDTKIDQVAHTIVVTVPYGTDLTKLTPKFTNDAFSTVAEGGTAGNFSTPKTFTVTSNNGTTNTYTVTVNTTARNDDATFKSFEGKKNGSTKLGTAYVLNGSNVPTDIILYDTIGTDLNTDLSLFKHVIINYALNNPFGAVHLGNETTPLKQGAELDLSDPATKPVTVTVAAQDSTLAKHVVKVHAVQAPLLKLHSAIPTTVDVNTGFVILVKALKSTVTNSKLDLSFDVVAPNGITVTSIDLTQGKPAVTTNFLPNTTHQIDFNNDVTIVLHVTDANLGGLMYDVKYTAGLTELK